MADHTRAGLFFNEVIEKGAEAFTFLCSLLNGGEVAAENGWRDYKEAGFIGKMDNPDEEKEKVKRIWSENLSAFANTGGGVLIWGFHTAGRIPDKRSLAADCLALAERLRSLVNDATDPYVAGVQIEAISDPQKPKQGFVICHIPASSFSPHQAQWGERTYFIRTQDSNLPCPQPLLRNMFFPRVRSRLVPIVRMEAADRQGGSILVILNARILSLGPATAQAALISIEPRELGQMEIHYDPLWETIGLKNIVRYRFPLPPNFFPQQPLTVTGTLLSNGASVVFRFFTDNTPAHHSVVSFTQEEVLDCLNKKQPLERRGQSNPIYP